MIYSKYFLSGLIFICGFLSLQQSLIAAQSDVATVVVVTPKIPVNVQQANNKTLQSCPQPGELVKNGLEWATKDGKWISYTQSASTKVLGFNGAQWIGIKVGTIICLYQTDEAVAFPVELEQVKVQSILEPNSVNWSSKVGGNRRICKSSSVADCQYFIELPKDTSNVYEEIKYAPNKNN